MEWATTVIPLESLKMIVNFFLTYDLDSYPAYVTGSGKGTLSRIYSKIELLASRCRVSPQL